MPSITEKEKEKVVDPDAVAGVREAETASTVRLSVASTTRVELSAFYVYYIVSLTRSYLH